jgi:Icc-related predicted phosphoesterase
LKALVVSDLHYTLNQFDWLVKVAGSFDAVVIAGDLLDIFSLVEPDVQIVVVTKYLDLIRAKTRLIVCSGNHDGDEKNEAGEFVASWLQSVRAEQLWVDGDSFRLGKDLVTVCPWWDGEVTRAAMVEQIKAQAAKPRERWIWIHHAPPDEVPVSWAGKKYGGDKFLNGLIERFGPDLVFCGHIHNAPFLHPEGSWISPIERTWTFNAGRQIGPAPAFIVVDLEANRADYVNMEGPDAAELQVIGSQNPSIP